MAEQKNYDLKDKMIDYGHANHINVSFPIEGTDESYRVRTSNIEEKVVIRGHRNGEYNFDILPLKNYYGYNFDDFKLSGKPDYWIGGDIYIARKKPLSVSGHKLPIQKNVWVVQTRDGGCNLSSPDHVADRIIIFAKKSPSIENQGIKIDYWPLFDLLTQALEPYIKRTDYFCGESGPFKRG